jgi:hypothetical protein
MINDDPVPESLDNPPAAGAAPSVSREQELGRPSFAVVTGASSGIGYELARACGEAGYDMTNRKSMKQPRPCALYAARELNRYSAISPRPKGSKNWFRALRGAQWTLLSPMRGGLWVMRFSTRSWTKP